jgi:transposase
VIAPVRKRRAYLLERLSHPMTEVQAAIEQALGVDKAWAAAAARLERIMGIGPLTAAWVLLTTLNFTLCQTAEELTASAGLAPITRQAGTSMRGHASIAHVGNARLRTSWSLATLAAAQHTPVIKTCW